MNPIRKISIRGYKSIRELEDFSLTNLNVLIGANGAGKSNFISFFRLLARLMAGELNYSIAKSGGPDAMLHYGRKRTPQMSAEMYFGNNGYKFVLEPTLGNTLIFARESFYWDYNGYSFPLGAGHAETLSSSGQHARVASYVVPSVKSWIVYHFHDTSDTAPMKQACALNDNGWLRPDGANLAAYLYRLREQFPEHYRRIVDTVQLMAPFFADFQLRPNPLDPNSIQLEWNEVGSDFPFLGHHLSDGSLRFICLATVLLQPDELMPASPPPTMIRSKQDMGEQACARRPYQPATSPPPLPPPGRGRRLFLLRGRCFFCCAPAPPALAPPCGCPPPPPPPPGLLLRGAW